MSSCLLCAGNLEYGKWFNYVQPAWKETGTIWLVAVVLALCGQHKYHQATPISAPIYFFFANTAVQNHQGFRHYLVLKNQLQAPILFTAEEENSQKKKNPTEKSGIHILLECDSNLSQGCPANNCYLPRHVCSWLLVFAAAVRCIILT